MPYLEVEPDERPVCDKLNVQYIVIDRMGADLANPSVRLVFAKGYYKTDGEGNPVFNSLGYPSFVPAGSQSEYTVRLSDPAIQALMLAREVEVKTYIAEHPEVPFFAVVDDYLTQLGLDYYQYLKNLPEPVPPEPVPPEEPEGE